MFYENTNNDLAASVRISQQEAGRKRRTEDYGMVKQ